MRNHFQTDKNETRRESFRRKKKEKLGKGKFLTRENGLGLVHGWIWFQTKFLKKRNPEICVILVFY